MKSSLDITKHVDESVSADKLKLNGIYRLCNIKDGRFYIGSTSQSFTRRWRQHLNDLYQNKHANKHLQAAWKKYGADNFTFDIVTEIHMEKGETPEIYRMKIGRVEDYYLTEAFINNNVFNQQKKSGAYSVKTSTTVKRRVISPTGEVHTVDNVSIFADTHKLNKGTFSNLLNKHCKSCKGWRLVA